MQHDLDRESVRMMAFSASSFANNEDLSTQLCQIMLLTYITNHVKVLGYAIYKIPVIVRSVLVGETYAFADAFDAAFIIRDDLEETTKMQIPLTMITDAESLFKVIFEASKRIEKRVIIDMIATMEAYNRRKGLGVTVQSDLQSVEKNREACDDIRARDYGGVKSQGN